MFAEETEMSQGCVACRAGLPQVLVISKWWTRIPVLFVNVSSSIAGSSLLLICSVVFDLSENGLMNCPLSNNWKNWLFIPVFSFFV